MWDVDLLHAMFFDIDYEAILDIPLSAFSRRDGFILFFDKKELHTFKIGYRAFMSFIHDRPSSFSNLSDGWWNRLWKIDVPKK